MSDLILCVTVLLEGAVVVIKGLELGVGNTLCLTHVSVQRCGATLRFLKVDVQLLSTDAPLGSAEYQCSRLGPVWRLRPAQL